MAEERSIGEILADDPFDRDEPSEWDVYLRAALQLAFANINGMTKALEVLSARIDEHEQAHRAANIAAMDMPDIVIKDDKPN